MSYTTLPIVGAFHRPPAQALIDVLAVGTPLFLMAEPTNAYDANAIQVYLESHNIPAEAHPSLEEAIARFGLDLDTVLSQDQWHLGYVPKEFAAQLRAAGTIMPNIPMDVEFALSSEGKPRVKFSEPVL